MKKCLLRYVLNLNKWSPRLTGSGRGEGSTRVHPHYKETDPECIGRADPLLDMGNIISFCHLEETRIWVGRQNRHTATIAITYFPPASHTGGGKGRSAPGGGR